MSNKEQQKIFDALQREGDKKRCQEEQKIVKKKYEKFVAELKEYIIGQSHMVFTQADLAEQGSSLGKLPKGYAELGHGGYLYYLDEEGNLRNILLKEEVIKEIASKRGGGASMQTVVFAEIKTPAEYQKMALSEIFSNFRTETTIRDFGRGYKVDMGKYEPGPLENIAIKKIDLNKEA